ncbi:MAG: acetate--CoA ligase family protein [Patescibacteria group bacterium]
MPRDLTTFFYPKSIAVIGASRSPQKVGNIILKNIINSKFKGKIYPVNPNTDRIDNLKSYKDIKNLPETPELAILAVPSLSVLDILKQCGDKKIKNVVVVAAGFKETGSAGAKLEKELTEIANKYQINLLGPNCLGFVNNNCPINATFGELLKEQGNLRFISQSGAIAASLFDWSNEIGLGISCFVTLGNKAILNENDFLDYFENEQKNTLFSSNQKGLSAVNPIGMYLESISNGKEFLNKIAKISKENPIFILKPGKTKASAQAMLSHTGAIAGSDAVLDAVLKQAGAIRCETMEDFFDLAKVFSWENAPKGPKIGIVSNAGGPGVISSDAIETYGLELAEFSAETKEDLLKILPRQASILNPVDVLGDALANRYKKAAGIVLEQDSVDALLIILTPQIMTQIAKTAEFIGELSQKYEKPIFCSFIGGKLVSEGEKKLNEFRIPSFRFPERAIYAISKMWVFQKGKDVPERPRKEKDIFLNQNFDRAKETIEQAIAKNYKSLDNLSANELISSAGIATPPTELIKTFERAKDFTEKNGWPVVLKLSSPEIIHKKRAGGVILDIINENQLEKALTKMQEKNLDIQIQKSIVGGAQVLVGVKRDITFGNILLFGAGGSFAELISDKNIHLLPMGIMDAKTLVENSKVYTLFETAPGEIPFALDKLFELIVRVGKLAESMPKNLEIEINPVIVNKDNAWAVDPKIIINYEPNI